MQKVKKISSISVTIETRKRLAALGKKNQSYENLVQEILGFVEGSDQWWAEKR